MLVGLEWCLRRELTRFRVDAVGWLDRERDTGWMKRIDR